MTIEMESEVRAQPGRYLTFVLAGEQYGMPIGMVEEVIGQLPLAPVPNTPSFILGVVNVRGRIIPVIDLRVKLRMKRPRLDRFSCIMILKIPLKSGQVNVGLMAETVEDIRQVTAEMISAPPSFGVKVNVDYLDGVVKVEGEPALLLINAIKAMTAKEMKQIVDAGQEEDPCQNEDGS